MFSPALCNTNKFPQHPSLVGVIFLITDDKLGSERSQGNCPRVHHVSLSEEGLQLTVSEFHAYVLTGRPWVHNEW